MSAESNKSGFQISPNRERWASIAASTGYLCDFACLCGCEPNTQPPLIRGRLRARRPLSKSNVVVDGRSVT